MTITLPKRVDNDKAMDIIDYMNAEIVKTGPAVITYKVLPVSGLLEITYPCDDPTSVFHFAFMLSEELNK